MAFPLYPTHLLTTVKNLQVLGLLNVSRECWEYNGQCFKVS
jgi:hypothetical protein